MKKQIRNNLKKVFVSIIIATLFYQQRQPQQLINQNQQA